MDGLFCNSTASMPAARSRANMAAGSPEVNSVPLMSLQVAAKLAKMATGFANARLTTNPHPAKCLQNYIDDLHRVAKAFEGLPVGAVKPGDEAGVLSFSSEFRATCGEDCPKPIPERTEDERATRDKFVGVMRAIGVMQDLFITKSGVPRLISFCFFFSFFCGLFCFFFIGGFPSCL